MILKFVRRTWSLLGPNQRKALSTSLVFRTISVVLDLIGVLILGLVATLAAGTKISNESISGQVLRSLSISPEGAITFGLFAALFFVIKSLYSVLTSEWSNRRIAEIETKVSGNLFVQIFSNPSRIFTPEKAALVERQLLTTTQMIFGIGIPFAISAFGEIALILAMLFTLAFVNAGYFLLLIFFVVGILALNYILVTIKIKREARITELENLRSKELISQTISISKNIFLTKKYQFSHRRFLDSRRKLARSQTKLQQLASYPRYISETSLMIAFALILMGLSEIGEAGINYSTVAIFIAGSLRIITSLLALQGAIGALKHVSESSDVSFEFEFENLKGRPNSSSDFGEKDTSPKPLNVSFENLVFRFEGSEANLIGNLNLKTSQKGLVFVSGPSGAGKSTLVDLLLGLLEPCEGTLRISDLSPLDFIARNPGAIAYVPQRPNLMFGNLLENVALEPSESLNTERATEALNLVGLGTNLHKFVSFLEDPRVNPNPPLSGGQLQLLGLARALYQDASIYIFDEPVSSLDFDSRSRVIKIVNELSKDALVFVVSHQEEDKFDWSYFIEFKPKNGAITVRSKNGN